MTTTRPGSGTSRRGRDSDARARPVAQRPLAVTGTIAACAAAGTGLVVVTMLVLVGWIAAPGSGSGLTGVLRTAALLWLISHHVAFSLPGGVGEIGMLPLGLALLPGALLWRAGHWVVRSGGVRRLRHVGYAALALAVPYAMLSGALAVGAASRAATPSLPGAVVCPFLLAVTAGGLGGARALSPWRRIARLLPVRARSLTVGTAGALAVLAAAGSLLVGGSLAAHLPQFRAADAALAPGVVGSALLLLAQLAYLPNAVIWGISFTLGPGFAFGTGTVVAPTGSALGVLPSFPMLAALPSGVHAAVPLPLSIAVLVVPYLAGAVGGLLTARTAPLLELQAAPLWGFGCGVATGFVLAVMAVFAGGPLGDGRLASVGPSGWQVGLVAVLEVGVAAAVTAGVVNLLRLRRAAARGDPRAGSPRPPGHPGSLAPRAAGPADALAAGPADDGHRIYLDPWAAAGDEDSGAEVKPPGPASLP